MPPIVFFLIYFPYGRVPIDYTIILVCIYINKYGNKEPTILIPILKNTMVP